MITLDYRIPLSIVPTTQALAYLNAALPLGVDDPDRSVLQLLGLTPRAGFVVTLIPEDPGPPVVPAYYRARLELTEQASFLADFPTTEAATSAVTELYTQRWQAVSGALVTADAPVLT
jgi:hypothetical protein